MSTPRLLTLAEIAEWERSVRVLTYGRHGLEALDRVIATLRNGAADRRRESLEAIEAEARSIARHMIDQARR